MLKRIILLSFICVLTFLLTHLIPGEAWGNDMEFEGGQLYFAANNSELNFSPLLFKKVEFPEIKIISTNIVDRYGIFDMPHRYAVKFVKFQGVSEGRLETYKKIGDKYIMQHTYSAGYPREGVKDSPWDMKTVGGNVVRYLYRTTRSGMNGYNKDREFFGVYKVSFPMPHDLQPLLKAGEISQAQYDKIPAINYRGSEKNQMLYPHPASAVGADIVLHTARKGSRGCIMVENEAMSRMYHEDLATENDQEIIPFVIYDEGVETPPIGQLL